MAIDGNLYLGDLNPKERTPFHLDGSLESALPLPPYQMNATGIAGQLFEPLGLVLWLEPFSASGGSADGMTLRHLQLSATAVGGSAVHGRLDLPAFTGTGAMQAALELAQLQLAGSAITGALAQAGSLALAPFSLDARGVDHAALALPPFQADAGGLAGSLSHGLLALARWNAAGTSYQDGSSAGELRLPLLQLAARGSTDSVLAASITLSPLALQASAVSGTVAQALLTLPLYAAGASGSAGDPGGSGFGELIGAANVLLPAFSLSAATVRLTRPHTVALVLNTRLKGVTRYDGLSANSFAQFAGVTLAATSEGIVALMGDTDLGVPIDAQVVSGTSDLGSTERKRIEAAYVGYRAANDLELTLVTDEHHEYTYRLVARQVASTLHNGRVKFGRGVDGRYWQWKLANTNGGKFELASLSLNVAPLSRSV